MIASRDALKRASRDAGPRRNGRVCRVNSTKKMIRLEIADGIAVLTNDRPEIKHGVIPDSGGTARLFQMAGHGLAADLALTGRVMDADEALRHGVVSRVVPDEKLEEVAMEMCREIASHPPFAVKMIRRTLARIAHPLAQRTMQEESMGMTAIYGTQDHAEMKAARAEGRPPKYRGR